MVYKTWKAAVLGFRISEQSSHLNMSAFLTSLPWARYKAPMTQIQLGAEENMVYSYIFA